MKMSVKYLILAALQDALFASAQQLRYNRIWLSLPDTNARAMRFRKKRL
jgi:hypothetical protein